MGLGVTAAMFANTAVVEVALRNKLHDALTVAVEQLSSELLSGLSSPLGINSD